MDMFILTIKQMLMMFTLIAIGFFLSKKKFLPDNAQSTMSKLEAYIFVPALSVYTQMTKCTVETFKENSGLIVTGLIIAVCAVLLSYPLSRLFVRKAQTADELYQRNIYKYALTFGNFGFMGNFIILGIWGTDMFYKYSLFGLCLSVICQSWGLYVLVPKDENAGILKNLKTGLLKPGTLAPFIGMAIGLLDLTRFIPEFLVTAFDNAGACQGPVAMVLAGVVIGGYNFKELILMKKVYVVSFVRLIAIPAVLMVILHLLGVSKEIMTLALVMFATPLGLNTIVFPAAYGGDTKTGASMTMISHTLSVITIPLMYLVFIVLW